MALWTVYRQTISMFISYANDDGSDDDDDDCFYGYGFTVLIKSQLHPNRIAMSSFINVSDVCERMYVLSLVSGSNCLKWFV